VLGNSATSTASFLSGHCARESPSSTAESISSDAVTVLTVDAPTISHPCPQRPKEGDLMSNATLSPEDELERARADYLAVSRGGHLYSTEDEHLRAESDAWERLERALAAVKNPEQEG
jgi:hypothetical protein